MHNADAARFLELAKQRIPAPPLAIARPKPVTTAQRSADPPDVATPYHDVLVTRAERLTRRATPAEQLLEDKLRSAKMSFVSQQVIGFYIADILLPDRMIIVEVDGAIHHSSMGRIYRDIRRSKWLNTFGFKVVRISNERVPYFSVAELLNAPLRLGCAAAIARANEARDGVIAERGYSPLDGRVIRKRVSKKKVVKPSKPKRIEKEPDELEMHFALALFYDRS